MNSKKITQAGMIAAVYYVLCVFLAPICYGGVQCRLSEAVLLLCINNPVAIWGYAIGCFFANLSSPLGVIDMILGPALNTVGGLIAYKTKSVPFILGFVPVLYGVFIGIEIATVFGAPFFVTAVSVAVGEFVALAVGCVLTRIAKRK